MADDLFLKKKNFTNKNIEKRRKVFGFNNTDTFRKFLWDLEIYKQIEKIAGNRICLKGGAATQFYTEKDYLMQKIFRLPLVCLYGFINVLLMESH